MNVNTLRQTAKKHDKLHFLIKEKEYKQSEYH